MTNEELNKHADQETSWLKYYGSSQENESGDPNKTTRKSDPYNDANFYDRITSIGYTKRVIPLPARCPAGYITSKKPVLESTVEELEYVSGPRNHENNVYTPLEYVFSKNIGEHEKFRELLRS
jgi:hypothetical protein